MEFAVVYSKNEWRKSIERRIDSLGGTISTKIHSNLTAVISNRKDLQKDSFLLRKAKELNVHVVSEEFLVDVAKANEPMQDIIIKRSLSKWGTNVSSSNANISCVQNHFEFINPF